MGQSASSLNLININMTIIEKIEGMTNVLKNSLETREYHRESLKSADEQEYKEMLQGFVRNRNKEIKETKRILTNLINEVI